MKSVSLNPAVLRRLSRDKGEEAVLEALHKNGIISKPLVKKKRYKPDYSEIPIENYGGRLPVLSTRGCPNRCSFCTQHLPLYFHSIESAVDQIENTPNIKEVIYNDSNINISKKGTKELFTRIARVKNPPRGHVFGLGKKVSNRTFQKLRRRESRLSGSA